MKFKSTKPPAAAEEGETAKEEWMNTSKQCYECAVAQTMKMVKMHTGVCAAVKKLLNH